MSARTVKLGLLSLLAALLAVGCATPVPREIGRAPANDISVTQVRADVQRYVGQPVRWGGTIVDMDNDAEESTLEIIARDLRRDGRPAIEDRSPGRFIAVVEGFLDPAIFTEDRDITVFGTIEGEVSGRIGGRSYDYPIVRVQQYQLWRVMDPRPYPAPGYRMYYYDPFYPWGYYYPYPGFRHHEPVPRRPNVLRR